MFKYETHLHTSPVSACAHWSVKEALKFYKNLGYDGVFITNHFIDGNIRIDKSKPYAEKIEFYFSDYEKAVKLGEKIGIKVFCGVEQSYCGTDFLIYGLDKVWFLNHPEIERMRKSEELAYYMKCGALVIQAHPFREASYIDHIRLFPRCVHGVEIINAERTDFENKIAGIYAENYGLLKFAGSDNHNGKTQKRLAGLEFSAPISNEQDFISRVKAGKAEIFTLDNK